MTADFTDLLSGFTAAVEAGNGSALAALFTEDGVYHDTFYGAFTGHAAIREMLEERFWGDAEGFLWDMFEPVFDPAQNIGYARWVFSYTATLPDFAGRRVAFDGMSRFALKDGLISHYREVFSAGLAFAQLGMAPERAGKILARMVDTHRDDPEWARHFNP